jgi:cytochrome c556
VAASAVAVFCGAALLVGETFAQPKKVEINEEWMEENVQTPYKDLLKGNRSNDALFKANADSYMKSAIKMAASMKIVGENPHEKPGKDKKVWTDSSAIVMNAAKDMEAAAKGQKLADFKTAFLKLETGCTKCHDVYKP